jgi:hypothetical protein
MTTPSDKDDDKNRARGNTDHDPKPEFASRRNVLARGVAAGPSFGGPGGTVARNSSRSAGPDDAPSKDGPPIAPQGRDGEKRSFRGFGSKDASRDRDDSRSKEQVQGKEEKSFRGFGRGDLSRDFDRSR